MRLPLVPTLLAFTACLPAEEVLDPMADQLPLVIITSTKVPSDPVTVPAAVAVSTGVQLTESGQTSIDDVAEHTAGVHFMNLGTHTTYPVIRGMFGLEIDPPTGYYVDGVAQRGLGVDQLLDVERVEVLRGPQGTLYGRNSVPGIVNIVTRDPGDIWSGYGILDGATRQTLGATAAAGGPLGGGVGLRLAARGIRSDAMITNTAPVNDDGHGRRDLSLQGKTRWTGAEGHTSITLAGTSNRFRNDGDHFAPVDEALERRTANNHVGAFTNDLDSGALTVSHDLAEGVTLTSVTGGNRYSDYFDIDLDYTPLDGIVLSQDTSGHVYSQELRLSGGQGLRSWVLGLYALDDRRGTVLDSTAKAPYTPVLPAPFPPIQPDLVTHSDGQLHTRNMAVFGQVGIPLGERLTFTTGLRLDYEHQQVHHNAKTVSPTLGGAVFSEFSYVGEQTFHAALPKASLSWSWTKTAFSYATVSRGYKSGGYNHTPSTQADIAGGYDPEYATVYEVGHRADLLDRRLTVYAAAYHTDYTNKQTVILESPRFYYVNAGRARIDGGELEVVGRPTGGLDVFANVGVIRSEITEYDLPAGSTLPDLTGKRLSQAPVYDGYLGFQWRHPSGLFVRPDLQLVGHYAADNDNNIIQAPYRKLGLRIGYEWTRTAVYLWGRNLNDAAYLTRGSTTSLPGPEHLVGVVGEPRTVGASAQVEF